jgi:hypothetical protein
VEWGHQRLQVKSDRIYVSLGSNRNAYEGEEAISIVTGTQRL